MKSERRSDETRIPDVEVLIQAAQSDVALVCFYFPSDIHQPAEIITAVQDPSELGAIRAVVAKALECLYSQDWKLVDELDAGTATEGGEYPPF